MTRLWWYENKAEFELQQEQLNFRPVGCLGICRQEENPNKPQQVSATWFCLVTLTFLSPFSHHDSESLTVDSWTTPLVSSSSPKKLLYATTSSIGLR